MSDIIQLLPDAVANQIAAGEVIQRPASVVKELVENAVDAGARNVRVIVKDAGRTMIQVIDDGKGMTETDARMAFERHATSKIKCANDLFCIKSMGFRGEALASIAAVGHVELNSRTANSELGTRIVIAGSLVETQEPVTCTVGSNFTVKNLFYNVPARRRFLKTNATELRHIINEFHRVAMANPQVAFSLSHNDQPLMNLPEGNMRQRIVGLIGRQVNSQLLSVDTQASVVSISGFIGKPQNARKTAGDQFFFVNNRFMKHPYLHKAVMNAYDNLLPGDSYPSYFIFFEVDPQLIDVNIHPTKTEIKFEDDRLIWKLLHAAVRESLGKHNVVPSIDFDTEGKIDIPAATSFTEVYPPGVSVNPSYNPFSNDYGIQRGDKPVQKGWESLYENFEAANAEGENDSGLETIVIPSKGNGEDYIVESNSEAEAPMQGAAYFQVKNRYIFTTVKSGLMIIEQKRAHERILYERFLSSVKTRKSATQQVLFADFLELNGEDAALLREIKGDLMVFGFEMQEENEGFFKVTGIPSELENVSVTTVLEHLLESYKTGEVDPEKMIQENLAAILARNACMKSGEALSVDDMTSLVSRLFQCEMPHYTPNGKPIISVLENEELDKRFY